LLKFSRPSPSAFAVLAFIYKSGGAGAVCEVLAELSPDTSYEYLMAQAAYLRKLGLKQVAEVVEQKAAEAPTEAALICAEQDADHYNNKSRLAYEKRRGNLSQASKEWMEGHLDQDTLGFVFRDR
jgi:hypothetical protein